MQTGASSLLFSSLSPSCTNRTALARKTCSSKVSCKSTESAHQETADVVVGSAQGTFDAQHAKDIGQLTSTQSLQAFPFFFCLFLCFLGSSASSASEPEAASCARCLSSLSTSCRTSHAAAWKASLVSLPQSYTWHWGKLSCLAYNQEGELKAFDSVRNARGVI